MMASEEKDRSTPDISIDEAWKLVDDLGNPDLTSEQVIRAYESCADRYEQVFSMVNYHGPKTMSDILTKYVLSKTARILDLGAGTGLLGEKLSCEGYTNVDANDACKDMLDKAKSKNVYKNFIHAPVGPERLPIDNDTYDVIATTGLFVPGHVNHKSFPELVRITKPGGYIFIVMLAKHIDVSPFFHGFNEAIQKNIDDGVWELLERREGSFYLDDRPSLLFRFRIMDTEK